MSRSKGTGTTLAVPWTGRLRQKPPARRRRRQGKPSPDDEEAVDQRRGLTTDTVLRDQERMLAFEGSSGKESREWVDGELAMGLGVSVTNWDLEVADFACLFSLF